MSEVSRETVHRGTDDPEEIRMLKEAQASPVSSVQWRTFKKTAHCTHLRQPSHWCFTNASLCHNVGKTVRLCTVRPIPLTSTRLLCTRVPSMLEKNSAWRDCMKWQLPRASESNHPKGIVLLDLLMCWRSIQLSDSMIYEWRHWCGLMYWHYTLAIWKFLAPTCMALYSGQERCTDFGGAAATKEPVRPDAGLIGFVRHFLFKSKMFKDSIRKTWGDWVCRKQKSHGFRFSYGFWICWNLLVWNLVAN